jgi:hypothetical protein
MVSVPARKTSGGMAIIALRGGGSSPVGTT